MSIVSRCEILSQLMQHGFQHADEGNLDALLTLGVPSQWIKKIQNLPPRRRNQACDLLASYLAKVLHQTLGSRHHQEHFTVILRHVNEEHLSQAEQDKLIIGKVSRDMMYSLYGTTHNEFRDRRRALGVTERGRPHRVSRKQEDEIWASWRRHESLPYPNRFLEVAQDTRLDLRTLWPVLRSALDLQPNRPGRQTNCPSRRATRRRQPSDEEHDGGSSVAVLYKKGICRTANAGASAIPGPVLPRQRGIRRPTGFIAHPRR